MPENPGHRLGWLDGLRGVASLAVVLFHYVTRFEEMRPPGRADIDLDLSLGAYGVQVFFVVSGFVIAGSLQRAPTAAAFAVSRFSRLWPAYAVAVMITSVGLWAWASGPSLPQLAVNLTMLAGFVGVPYVDGVYWTLTLELMFYGWMLALYRAGALKRPELLVVVWTGLHALNVGLLLPRGLGSELIRELWFEEGIFFFLTGVLLERCAAELTWARGAALAWVVVLSGWVQGPTELAVHIGTIAVFGLGLSGWLGLLEGRALLWLGAVSYPLYLVHQELGYVLIAAGRDLGLPSWPVIGVTLALALALSHAISRAVERPAMVRIRSAAVAVGLTDRA